MSNLVRLIIIVLVVMVVGLLLLLIGGGITSSELWDNLVKIVAVAGVLLLGTGLVMLVSKK